MTLVVKNLPANAGNARNTGLIPGLGRSPGEGHGNPLQCSCLENSMEGGAWRATVHGVTSLCDMFPQFKRLISISSRTIQLEQMFSVTNFLTESVFFFSRIILLCIALLCNAICYCYRWVIFSFFQHFEWFHPNVFLAPFSNEKLTVNCIVYMLTVLSHCV